MQQLVIMHAAELGWGERLLSQALFLMAARCLSYLRKTASAKTKCPHEAAYDAFLCGSGKNCCSFGTRLCRLLC
jgi:hypothetical protein